MGPIEIEAGMYGHHEHHDRHHVGHHGGHHDRHHGRHHGGHHQVHDLPIPVPHLPDLTGVPDFVAGLVYGLTGHNHLDEIQHCFDGSSDMLHHVQAALDDIRHLHLI